MTAELDPLATLLDAPAAAALTTFRKDGTAVTSPVWFRRADGWLEIVIADGDPKLRHLERTPRCALLVFETTVPFRGLRIDCTPVLSKTGVEATRRAIARKYLGQTDGDRFTDNRGQATVVRLPLHAMQAWDLTAILPN